MGKKGPWMFLAAATILGFLLLAGGCAQQGGTKTGGMTTLKLGHVGPASEDHSWEKFAKKYAQLVAERTGGKVKIETYPASQLGADREMAEALQQGTLEMGLISTMAFGNFVPELQVWDLPYIFPSEYAKIDQILDGPIGEEMARAGEAKGYKILAFWENDVRHMSNSKRPIRKVSDLKGLKMRTPETPGLIKWLSNIGAIATPVAFSELYTALQQKTVDGQDNGVGLTYSAKLYEPQKYYSLTGHIYSPLAVIVSKKVWDTLPADVQKVLTDVAKELAPQQRAYNRECVAKWLDEMKAKGLQVNEIEPEDLKEFRESAKPVYEEYRQRFGSLVDKMVEAAGE